MFSPPIYFLRIFFWNRFFLCGRAGFIHAATGAMYSLMTEAIHRQLYYARRMVEACRLEAANLDGQAVRGSLCAAGVDGKRGEWIGRGGMSRGTR